MTLVIGYTRYVGTYRGVPSYYAENCQAGTEKCQDFTPIGYIPQVSHTFSYWEETYGTMNEKQVRNGPSTKLTFIESIPLLS